jgi:putative ABC transport system permease protein
MARPGLASLYSDFFHFPFLIFRIDASVYLIARGDPPCGGDRCGPRRVERRRPVARRRHATAAPTRYRRLFGGVHIPGLSQTTIMITRHIIRWPLRAGFTVIGIALSVAVLVGSMFSQDAIEHMIDVTFFQTDRQDATINFVQERSTNAISDITRLPGVMTAEPMRAIPARLSNGHLTRRVAIEGRPPDSDLSRLMDSDGRMIVLPETGLVLSDMLADVLEAGIGDLVEVETLEGSRRTADIPVTAVVQGYIGMASYMDITAVNRLMREGAMMTGVHVKLDSAQTEALFTAIKEMPAVASIGLQSLALQTLRETMAENLLIMTGMFTGLALVIAFGVVYNSARIQLSERARELASLRVFGFTRGEVSWILLAELAILTIAAIPVGWLIGYGLALAMVIGFETELFRIPLVIERATYARAAFIVLGAAAVSALIVRRRIDRFDLVEVLKTRE